MKFKLFILTAVILTLPINATSESDIITIFKSQKPSEWDIVTIFESKTTVTLEDLHDPGFVVLSLNNGEKIDTVYSGIDYKVLSGWLEKQKETSLSRKMYMTYSDTEGILITDEESGTIFELVGEIKDNHPIDLAIGECREQAISTLDYQACNSHEMFLWTVELNHVFKGLGDEGIQMKKAFDQYLDAYTEFLHSEYGKREGTLWGLVSQSHIIDLIREQINFFGRVKEW